MTTTHTGDSMHDDPLLAAATRRRSAPAGDARASRSDDAPKHDELARRAAEWERTRRIDALWPGIDRHALQRAADALGDATGAWLRGERAALPPALGDDPRALGIASMVSGAGPLVALLVERGETDAPSAVAAVLAEHLAEGRARMARIRAGLAPALDALRRAGIQPVVMKGMHTAFAYFADPGARPISDVDLIVAPEEVDAAEAALAGAGFAGSAIVRTPYKRDWYPPDDDARLYSLEHFDARDRWKIELHAGVSFDYLAWTPLPLLDDRGTVEWDGLGTPMRVPAPEALVALLAAHASGELYARRLLRLAELALVIRRERTLSWREVERVLERSAALRLAHPALALVERLAPGTVDAATLALLHREASPFARRVVARFTATRPLTDDHVALDERLMWTTGTRSVVRALVRPLLPERGAGWRGAVGAYQRRLRRLRSGRVVLGSPADG